MFVGIHAILAERTDTPELAITEDEGKQFMQAAQNVMRHYSVESTQKTLDWVALFGCAGAMYMPRIAAVGMRKRSSARKSGPRPQAAPAQNGAGMGAGVVSIVPDMTGTAGFQEG